HRAERGPWATHATGALRGAAEGPVAPGCDARAEREGFPQENLVAQRWEGTTMTRTRPMTLVAAATLLIGVTTAMADYHTNPELKPSSRCGTALQKSPLPNPGNIESLENYTTDCQPLYWDLPATVQLHVPVRAAYDPVTGFLHGPVDRQPPRVERRLRVLQPLRQPPRHLLEPGRRLPGDGPAPGTKPLQQPRGPRYGLEHQRVRDEREPAAARQLSGGSRSLSRQRPALP